MDQEELIFLTLRFAPLNEKMVLLANFRSLLSFIYSHILHYKYTIVL